MKRLSPDETMGTVQIARLLQVSDRTVRKWCDTGLLRFERLPTRSGGKPCHRRVRVDDLKNFCLANGIGLSFTRPPVVLVAGIERTEPLLESLPGQVRWSVGSILQIAHLAGTDPPTAVFLGCDEGLGTAVKLAEILLATPYPPAMAIVLGEDSDPWDTRLSTVRSRLKWLGIEPASWDGVLRELGLLPRVKDVVEAISKASEKPGGLLAHG